MAVPKIPIEIDVDGARSGLSDVGSAFDSFAARAAVAFDPINIAMRIFDASIGAVTSAIKRATEAAFEGERENLRLTTALKLQGAEWQKNRAAIDAFNTVLQDSLGIGDEQSKALETQLLLMGVQANKLQVAMKATIGLAEVTGSLESAARLAARALGGEVSALTRYGIRVLDAADAQDKLLELYEVALSKSGTLEQRVSTLTQNYGDLWEELGTVITKSDAVNDAFATTAERVKTITTAVGENNSKVSGFIDLVVQKFNAHKTELLAVAAILGGPAGLGAATTAAQVSAVTGAIDAETARQQRRAARHAAYESESPYGELGRSQFAFNAPAVEFGESESEAIMSDPAKLLAKQLARQKAAQAAHARELARQKAAHAREIEAAAREGEGNYFFGIPVHALEEIKSTTDAEMELLRDRYVRRQEIYDEEIASSEKYAEDSKKIAEDLQRFQKKQSEQERKEKEQQQAWVTSFGASTASQFASMAGSMVSSIIVSAIAGDEANKKMDEVIGSFVMSFGAYLIQAGTAAMLLSALSLIPGLQAMGGGPAGIAVGALTVAAGVGMVAAGNAMGGSLSGSTAAPATPSTAGAGGGERGSVRAPESPRPWDVTGSEVQPVIVNVAFNGPVGGSARRIARDLQDVMQRGGVALPAFGGGR